MIGYAKISGTILKGDQCENALITFIFLTEIKRRNNKLKIYIKG